MDGKNYPAYRVQYNNARGPYKGGIRFHPDVHLDEVKSCWNCVKQAVCIHFDRFKTVVETGGEVGVFEVDVVEVDFVENETGFIEDSGFLVDGLSFIVANNCTEYTAVEEG